METLTKTPSLLLFLQGTLPHEGVVMFSPGSLKSRAKRNQKFIEKLEDLNYAIFAVLPGVLVTTNGKHIRNNPTTLGGQYTFLIDSPVVGRT